MNVLWITNILFPEANQLLSHTADFKSSGGWMLGAAEALLQNPDIQLSVATVSTTVSELVRLQGNKIIYYVLPYGKGNDHVNLEYSPYWKRIKSEFNPDVIHIHGTEFSHGHAYLKACGSNNVVVSIQGLLSGISPYYCAGISNFDIIRNITIRGIVAANIINEKNKFEKRSKYEREMITLVDHVIGRTLWDKTWIWSINPSANYHFCNETLREEFYTGEEWTYDKCVKHSIFVSQAGYPLKGFHQLLKALPLILRHYPDTTIRVAGIDITAHATLLEKIRLSGYGNYIHKLINQSNLDDKIRFTGSLTGEEMKKEYLQSNVFVCPSSIENSPNSLGEAQILGVPCVASYVGGIPDMMKGNEENLYRFEDIEILAAIICKVFMDKENQVNMKKEALERHNVSYNSNLLYTIYNNILGVNK